MQKALLSVTFRAHTRADIVQFARGAGLDGIEWGGDVHVPPGNAAAADEARRLCGAAGLSVAAYGSYYRAGEGEDFSPVLETASALRASRIRVWAGRRASSCADDAYRAGVARDLRRCAEEAARGGAVLVLEYHEGTLTDTLESTQKLLFDEAVHPALFTGWQPPVGESETDNLRAIRLLHEKIASVHVFAWEKQADALVRLPLEAHAAAWRRYFAALAGSPAAYAGLEFVRGDSPEQMYADARTLRTF